MTTRTAFLECGHATRDLLGHNAITNAWNHASALEDFNLGALAGHTAFQVLSVNTALASSDPGDTPLVGLRDHYQQAAWLNTPITSPANTKIRSVGADLATDGPGKLAEALTTTLADLETVFADLGADHVVYVPNWGYRVRLDDYLRTRVMEMVVHLDDLAVSVDIEGVELSQEANAEAVEILADLSAQRHGWRALVRSLARQERAGDSIVAFLSGGEAGRESEHDRTRQ